MIRKRAIQFVLMATFACGVGQPIIAQAPPPPPPAKDYFPNQWKEFRSVAGAFLIKFPDQPTESVKAIETTDGKMILHSWSYGNERFIFYSVSYRDLPKEPRNEEEARKVLKEGRDNRLPGIEDKLKPLSEEEITHHGQPALRLEFELRPNKRLRELHVIRGGRHYNVMVITFSDHKGMASENAYETIANSFLASFQRIERDRQ